MKLPVFSLLTDSPADGIPIANLRRLIFIRGTAVLGLTLVLLISWIGLDLVLPVTICLAVLLVLAGDNLWTWQATRHLSAVSHARIFRRLSLDIVGLTLLLYFTGGHANPFTSLFLLPLAVAATTLPVGDTWALTLASVAAYTGLVFFNRPMVFSTPAHHEIFGLHLVGMWGSFLLAAGVIAVFVASMAEALRQRDRSLAETREAALRDQQVVALGALAAGTAHELGTPLSTMALLVGDLRERHQDDASLAGDLRVLQEQISRCRESLNRALTWSGEPRGLGASRLGVDAFVGRVIERWQNLRPDRPLQVSKRPGPAGAELVADETLIQAIISILSNAADASAEPVRLEADWQSDKLRIRVRDQGPGIDTEWAENLGKPFVSSKETGHGVGLFLAQNIIRRAGGEMAISWRPREGTQVDIVVPIDD